MATASLNIPSMRCLQGSFLLEKGLTRVPHQRAHQGGFSSPFSYSPSPLLQAEATLHPRAPLLRLAKTPDQH